MFFGYGLDDIFTAATIDIPLRFFNDTIKFIYFYLF